MVVALGVAMSAEAKSAEAKSVTLLELEPDNYADTEVVNTVLDEVTLVTLDNFNRPIFDVTANVVFKGLSSTGKMAFGHANVGFWNDYRRLRMTFSGTVQQVNIDFIGWSSLDPSIGQLEAYNAEGNLLDIYLTGWMGSGQWETMSISRPSDDIAYAIAYIADGNGSSGGLDHLVFSAPVAEPSSITLAGIGCATLLAAAWRRRKRVA